MSRLISTIVSHIKQIKTVISSSFAIYAIGVISSFLIFLLLETLAPQFNFILTVAGLTFLLLIGAIIITRQTKNTGIPPQISSEDQKRLRLYFSLLPERVLIMNYDGVYLDMLQAHYSPSRPYTGGDRIGRRVHDVFDKEFADYCLQAIRLSIDSQTMQTIEYERSHDGEHYFIQARVVPFKDPISGESQAMWVSSDISPRKQAEQGLVNSEKRLRTFVNVLPDRIIILDSNGVYHDILSIGDDSNYVRDMGGLKGETIHDRYDPDFVEFCLAKIRQALAENTLQVFEYDFVRENQTYFLEGRVIPYRDPTTEEARVIWLSRDITARKVMEESLIENDKLLRTIIESLPDRTMIFDEDGRYKEVLQPAFNNNINPTWTIQAQIGKTIKDIFPDEFANFCLEMIYKTLQTGETQIFQYPSPVAEVPLYFEARTVPFRDTQTGKFRVLWVTRDITDQKQAEQRQLELALEREKLEFFQQFVSNMTHDLKTPLTVIETSLYLLQRSKDDLSREQRAMVIRKQLDLLQQMIDDMLTIGRLDTLPQLELERVDYIGLLQETIAELRPRAEQKRQQLQVSLAADSALIPTSKYEIRRAMTNLIDNAIKYTPDYGHVDVRVYPDNEAIVTEVQDTGIGIQSADIPHIFDRFFRSDNGRSVANGTGLGLAITQRIIELHGGQIEVESMIGQGTTFRVRLPAS